MAHYSDSTDRIKELKGAGRLEEAKRLLLNAVDATEAEAKREGGGRGVAPWYYEQLAIIYRKMGCPDDELAILERYDRQPKARGARAETCGEAPEGAGELIRLGSLLLPLAPLLEERREAARERVRIGGSR